MTLLDGTVAGFAAYLKLLPSAVADAMLVAVALAWVFARVLIEVGYFVRRVATVLFCRVSSLDEIVADRLTAAVRV